jgi:hypothetical protein
MRKVMLMLLAITLQCSGALAWSAAPASDVPRLQNGKPDLSGHWANPYTPDMATKGRVLDPASRQPMDFPGQPLPDSRASAAGGGVRTLDLPHTEWGLQQWKTYDPVNDGDYAGSCLPFGLSRSINSPHGVQLLQTPQALAMMFEQNTWFHWVPTAGQKWPQDMPASWTGVSTGRWDGDTLIVETTGFNGYTRLDTAGHPHSRQLRLTNTFRRIDATTIEHTVTVHDPKTYTRDWMNLRTWRLKPDTDMLLEYSCEENNLDNLMNGTIKPWKPPQDDEDE